jgi:predicted dehydrogenase
MQVIVAGLSTAGKLRQTIAQHECVGTVDLLNDAADYCAIQEIPAHSYDAVLVCLSAENKYQIIRYALANKKHVLVEAPLCCPKIKQLEELIHLAVTNNVILYVAYPNRFDPKLQQLQQLIVSNTLGNIYHARASYAIKAHASLSDPVTELGAQVLLGLNYVLGDRIANTHLNVLRKKRLNSATPEHIIIADLSSDLGIEIEINLLAKHERFTLEIYGTADKADINLLPQTAELYQQEYLHFKNLCTQNTHQIDFSFDQWIQEELRRLSKEELLLA